MIHATVRLCVLAGFGLFSGPFAFAETENEISGITSFLPADFSQYSPTSALDMVSQVPGFSINSGDDVRGFGGAAGNVLVNGERPSTKSDLESYLRRIPAANIERIELVRGASGDLDMRGQTRIVNVILKDDVSASQFSYSVNPRMHQGGRVSVGAVADWNGKWMGGDLTLSYSQGGWAERVNRLEKRYDSTQAQIAFRDDVHQTNNIEYLPGFEYERTIGENTKLHLNGRVWTGFWKLNAATDEYTPDGAGTLTYFERGTIDEEWWGYDIGGDIQRDLTDKLATKLIWYSRRDKFDSDTRFDDYLADGGFEGAFEANIDDYYGESILRTQTDWTPNGAHSIGFGIEGAYNFRDADRTFLNIDTSGNLPGAIPVSTTRVEEWRGEAFISDVWKPFAKWTIEPGLKVEVSEISQTGDAEAKRQFTYPKPSLSATYTPQEGTQWRFLIERRVAQLDFEDFVSNVSATDDNVTSGNPDLEPEQSWRFDLGYERPLTKGGTISVIARYEAVEKVQDLVPVTATSGDVFDGPGNLGDGHRFQIISEASIPTDRFGIRNGKLDLELTYSDSEVEDPLTGEKRNFSYEQPLYWYVEFRQDFPEAKWSWGFDFSKGSTDESWRTGEMVSFSRGYGDFDIYIETTKFLGLNIKVGVDNVFDPTFERTRTLYDGSRADQLIARQDVRQDQFGPLYFIRFKDSFTL